MTTSITVAYGDGIGPEIMEAALFVLREAGAALKVETVEVGERIYMMGGTSGILPSAWSSLNRTYILLKAPTLPPPTDHEDVSIALRKAWNLEERAMRRYDFLPDVAAGAWANGPFALFEAVQDAAPRLAGKNTADPSGMLAAAVLMLEHIGQARVADMVHDAWLRTLEDGIIAKKTGTREFAEAVVERLGKKPAMPVLENMKESV